MIVYLSFFLPLPKAFSSLVFKLSFLSVLALLVIYLSHVSASGAKTKIHLIKAYFPIFLLVLLLVIFGVYEGFLYSHSAYTILKEALFFIFPFAIVFLLAILTYDELKILTRKLTKVANAYIILQLFILVVFFLYLKQYSTSFETFRFLYRKVGLLITSAAVPVIWVLYLSLEKKMFSKQSLFFALGTLITFGRLEAIFVIYMMVSMIAIKLLKNKKLRKLYLIGVAILLASAPVIYWIKMTSKPYWLDPNMSNRWRRIELQSFLYAIKHTNYGFLNLLLGKGFGAKLQTLEPLHMFEGEVFYKIDRFHNLYLFILLKLGLVGLAFFLLIIFLLLFVSLQRDELAFLFLLFYFFMRASVMGGFTMSLDINLAMILFLAFVSKRESQSSA